MTVLLMTAAGCTEEGTVNEDVNSSDEFLLEAWADNWFAMYIDGTLIVEDSVSITTERSFNAERKSFSAERPFTAGFMLKDFKETDSGIEYIGESNQQMGDGGFIAQIVNLADSSLVVASDGSWRCLVTHEAPLNKDCESASDPNAACDFRSDPEPTDWALPTFDDSAWPLATVHTASDVDPKDGYDAITWNSAASLIWGADLEADNTVLCRVVVP